MQINLQSAHPLSGTSIIKEPPSCKRTRAGSTLLRTTCYTIRAEFCQYLSHLTAGTPSVPTFSQFRKRNSGVIFSRSYLHRASTCPRLSAAFSVPLSRSGSALSENSAAYCLHHCFYAIVYTYYIIMCTISIVKPFFQGLHFVEIQLFTDYIWFPGLCL